MTPDDKRGLLVLAAQFCLGVAIATAVYGLTENAWIGFLALGAFWLGVLVKRQQQTRKDGD
jgi:dolichyl-phosphate-mannose--protein O-mannosyl transferase